MRIFTAIFSKKLLALTCFFVSSGLFGQNDDNMFSRLQAIKTTGPIFYNIDGIEITSQVANAEFTAKNIFKHFKELKIKEKELTTADSSLAFRNFYVFKTAELSKGLNNNLSYYFVESPDKKILAFTFNALNKTDRDFERNFVKLVRDNAIPDSVYQSMDAKAMNFAGREIGLSRNCHWMGINNMQCTLYGQMNWSVHKSLEDASATANNHLLKIKAGNKGKIISDTTVGVLFEDRATTARKIVYDFTGINSLLVGMSGGKTLTIYFVAAPVRNNFVSCVMSHWNNDQINASGLSPLLEQVMKLQP